jgi:hypothetical protein
VASVSIACSSCNEAGCDECGQTGYIELTGCPKEMIDRGLLRAIRMADLMKQGLPPVAGGVLDQSAWFVSFYECFRSEQNRAEAEAYRRM